MTNIVVLSVDCLRADHVGCYGYSRDTTPNIDTFAKTASLYEHGYANGPGTRWAFQSLLAGVSPVLIDGLGIPDDYEPLPQILSKNGYSTGWFGVNGLVSREYNYDVGFDTFYGVEEAQAERGFVYRFGKKIGGVFTNDLVKDWILKPLHERLYTRVEDTSHGEFYRPSHTDKDTTNNAISYIQHQSLSSGDFFCWVHFMDAHTPYGRWPEHLEMIRGNSEIEHTIHPGSEGKIEKGKEPPESVIDTYDACIRRVDEQIGRILDVLPSDTLVIITGDHGEDFGIYRGFHVPSFFSAMTQVPVIIRGGNFPVRRIETPAQHLDLPPTILKAANIEIPTHWEGEPLQCTTRGTSDPIYFGLDRERCGVRVGEWKYFEYGKSKELYRTPHSCADGRPVTNDFPEKVSELKSLINQYRSRPTVSQGANGLESEEDEISDVIRDNLEELGYL